MENKIQKLELNDNKILLNFKPYEIHTVMVLM